MTLLLLLLCSLVSLGMGSLKVMGPCTTKYQQTNYDYLMEPDDCHFFYRCASGVLFRRPCAKGTVFNPSLMTCVHEDGQLNICSNTEYVCSSSSSVTRIPSSRLCSLYYDCEAPSRSRWAPHLQECAYPTLFNTANGKCEHFSMVVCGDREVPLGPCEYEVTKYALSHGIPCNVMNPSCRGMTDGVHPYTGRLNSPYFMECLKERLVKTDTCPQKDGRTQLFDPDELKCVPVGP